MNDVDKGKLLEWERKNCCTFEDFEKAEEWVSSDDLREAINSGELDPDITTCADCSCQEFTEDPNQFICKRCGLCVDKNPSEVKK